MCDYINIFDINSEILLVPTRGLTHTHAQPVEEFYDNNNEKKSKEHDFS